MNVAVCIPTFRRPDGLGELLSGLGKLTFSGPEPELVVVVVDNDAEGTAREVCNTVREDFPWELDYCVEPRRGIPFARNTAIARALQRVDLVAFLDDDEVPQANWLDELLWVQREYDADVVAGPVLPRFVAQVPPWVNRGRFFHRRRWPTGTRLDRAFTGNILFHSRLLSSLTPHFDERLALTGGEDSHFLQRVHRAGYDIVWADDAVVHETVAPTRVNSRWILRRAYRTGTSTAYIQFDFHAKPVAAARLIAVGCLRVLQGSVQFVITGLFGRRFRVAALRYAWYGAGLLVGLTGRRYHEYKETHRV